MQNRIDVWASPEKPDHRRGELVWATQLGRDTKGFPGGDNAGWDECNSVVVDNPGSVYCAGFTESAIGETNGGVVDAFVIKLSSNRALE